MVTFIQPFLVFVQRRIKDKERMRAKRGGLHRKQSLSKVMYTLRCPYRACLTPLNRKQQQQEALQAKFDAYQKGETSRLTNLANEFERAYAQAKGKDALVQQAGIIVPSPVHQHFHLKAAEASCRKWICNIPGCVCVSYELRQSAIDPTRSLQASQDSSNPHYLPRQSEFGRHKDFQTWYSLQSLFKVPTHMRTILFL